MVDSTVSMQAEYDKLVLQVDGREGLVLFFKVGDQTFGIRLTEVSHIQPFRKAETSGGLDRGLIVWGTGPGNEDVPAVDLHAFLGVAAAKSKEDRILILFREGGERFGLLAGEVQAIVPAAQSPEMAYPKLLGEMGAEMYGGFFIRDGRLVLALNPGYIWNLLTAGRKL